MPRPRCLLLSVCLLAVSLTAAAAAPVDSTPETLAERMESRRLAISAGVFYVRFDSTYKVSNTAGYEQVFVDLEGQLELPSTEVVGSLSALWRFKGKNYLAGTYTRLRRSAERLVVDESFIIENDVVTLNGNTSARLDYDFFDLNYAYAFHHKEKSVVLGKAGVHIFSTDGGFLLEGDIAINDEAPESGKIDAEAKFVAAFPLVGFAIDFQLEPRFSIENVVDFIYLPVSNTQAVAIRTQLGFRYKVAPRFGLRAGLSYNFERVEYTERDITHEVEFDFSGLMLKAYLKF